MARFHKSRLADMVLGIAGGIAASLSGCSNTNGEEAVPATPTATTAVPEATTPTSVPRPKPAEEAPRVATPTAGPETRTPTAAAPETVTLTAAEEKLYRALFEDYVDEEEIDEGDFTAIGKEYRNLRRQLETDPKYRTGETRKELLGVLAAYERVLEAYATNAQVRFNGLFKRRAPGKESSIETKVIGFDKEVELHVTLQDVKEVLEQTCEDQEKARAAYMEILAKVLTEFPGESLFGGKVHRNYVVLSSVPKKALEMLHARAQGGYFGNKDDPTTVLTPEGLKVHTDGDEKNGEITSFAIYCIATGDVPTSKIFPFLEKKE